MPEPKRTVVFFEGDDDKAFLEGLQEAKLLPDGWQLAKRDKQQHPGKDGLIRQLLPVVSPVNGIDGRAVVLVDLDNLSPPERVEWFRSALAEALQKEPRYAGIALEDSATIGRVQGFRLISGGRIGHVAVVPVGHPEDAELNAQYQIDRFAIDDWVLRLALNQKVFENVSDLSGIKFDVAVKKYREVGSLFRDNGLEVRKAKTYVQILRVLAAQSLGPAERPTAGRDGRGELMTRFLVDEGVGSAPRYWKLAQSLSALYPGGSDIIDALGWVDDGAILSGWSRRI